MRKPKRKNGLYVRVFKRVTGDEKPYLGSMTVHTLTYAEVMRAVRIADEVKRAKRWLNARRRAARDIQALPQAPAQEAT